MSLLMKRIGPTAADPAPGSPHRPLDSHGFMGSKGINPTWDKNKDRISVNRYTKEVGK